MRFRDFCRTAVPLMLAFVFTSGGGAVSKGSRPIPEADETQVVETVRTIFAAAAADDFERFHSVVTADFYAFDGGKRYEGDALMNLVKGLHQAGNVYVWTVNEPEVHVSCNLAWITYVNKGSLKNASGTQNLTWLESAVLKKESGRWKIRFVHSTRVP
ncbi:MAG: nuclear transport factor 2 family protein [Candidatus Acidiferrales bacterium]